MLLFWYHSYTALNTCLNTCFIFLDFILFIRSDLLLKCLPGMSDLYVTNLTFSAKSLVSPNENIEGFKRHLMESCGTGSQCWYASSSPPPTLSFPPCSLSLSHSLTHLLALTSSRTCITLSCWLGIQPLSPCVTGHLSNPFEFDIFYFLFLSLLLVRQVSSFLLLTLVSNSVKVLSLQLALLVWLSCNLLALPTGHRLTQCKLYKA